MSKTYEVDQWTVIMAIRYGMGRMTYANEDAARLAKWVWPDLSEADKRVLRVDASHITDESVRRAWGWMLEEGK